MSRFALAVLLVGAGVVGVVGCDRLASQDPDVPGTATFTLSATGASGTVYRLRSAKFNVTGPESKEIVGPTDPQDTKVAITTQMQPGNYQITLETGWLMWRIPTVGDPVVVAATVVSPSTLPFTILSAQDTNVIFHFDVAGDVLTPSTLTVGIAVTEVDAGAGEGGAPLDPCRACEMTRCKIAQPPPAKNSTLAPYYGYSVCFSSNPLPNSALGECDTFDPTLTTAAHGPAAGTPKSALCQAALACVRSSPSMCASSSGNFDKCYCGTLDDATCVSGQATPNGDCKSALEAASESTDPSTVAGVSGNPCGAAGAAQDVFGFCDLTCCAFECHLASTPQTPDSQWCLTP
jgi:hypothetical protein